MAYGYHVGKPEEDRIFRIVKDGMHSINELPFSDTFLDFVPFGKFEPSHPRPIG